MNLNHRRREKQVTKIETKRACKYIKQQAGALED